MPQPNFNFNPDVVFPLPVPAKTDFAGHNQTSFGWNRDGGHRKHAGVDLEAEANTPVLAMADGVVLRSDPAFYQGTGVIEIQHPGIGIIRYGEIDPYKRLVLRFQRVRKGQLIAFVGKRDKATRFMLHLELYTDWSQVDVDNTQRLTDKSQSPFQRRDDLRNPTVLLKSAPLRDLSHLSPLRSPFQQTLDGLKLQRMLAQTQERTKSAFKGQ